MEDGLHGPRTVEGELDEIIDEIEQDAQHETDTRTEPDPDEPPVPDDDIDHDDRIDHEIDGEVEIDHDDVDHEDHLDPPPAPDRHRPTQARPLAIIPGHGVVPPSLLAELIGRGATVRPIRTPGADAEPRYRPSAITEHFVRTRDLTCRAPGCDRPAEFTDIDHTVPYPAGATHPGGLKCYCRKHHLVKTFHDGWSDSQLPDGTVVITTPTGHTYTTKPGITLL